MSETDRNNGIPEGRRNVRPFGIRCFHFHVCVIDGVFCEDPDGSVQFSEATISRPPIGNSFSRPCATACSTTHRVAV